MRVATLMVRHGPRLWSQARTAPFNLAIDPAETLEVSSGDRNQRPRVSTKQGSEVVITRVGSIGFVGSSVTNARPDVWRFPILFLNLYDCFYLCRHVHLDHRRRQQVVASAFFFPRLARTVSLLFHRLVPRSQQFIAAELIPFVQRPPSHEGQAWEQSAQRMVSVLLHHGLLKISNNRQKK